MLRSRLPSIAVYHLRYKRLLYPPFKGGYCQVGYFLLTVRTGGDSLKVRLVYIAVPAKRGQLSWS